MATPFQTVFQRFLNKITDSDLAALPQTNLESIMTDYLQSSIVRFRKCKQNLENYNLTSMQFNIDLTLTEIEILAFWMKFEWLDQQINRIELLRQSLSSKDYAMYSQANHLNSLISLREITSTDVYKLMKYYSYDNNDLTGLVGNGN
jgi:hypothetical protein